MAGKIMTKKEGQRYLLILDIPGDRAKSKEVIANLANWYIKYFAIPTGPAGRCFSTREKDIDSQLFRTLSSTALLQCTLDDKLYICAHGNDTMCGSDKPSALAQRLSDAGLKRIGLVTFKSCQIGKGNFLDGFLAQCNMRGLTCGYAKGYKDNLLSDKAPPSTVPTRPVSMVGHRPKRGEKPTDKGGKYVYKLGALNRDRFKIVRGASAVHVQWSDRYLTQMEHLAKQRQAGETALQNFRDDNLEELAQFVEEVDLFAVNPHFRGEQI